MASGVRSLCFRRYCWLPTLSQTSLRSARQRTRDCNSGHGSNRSRTNEPKPPAARCSSNDDQPTMAVHELGDGVGGGLIFVPQRRAIHGRVQSRRSFKRHGGDRSARQNRNVLAIAQSWECRQLKNQWPAVQNSLASFAQVASTRDRCSRKEIELRPALRADRMAWPSTFPACFAGRPNPEPRDGYIPASRKPIPRPRSPLSHWRGGSKHRYESAPGTAAWENWRSST